MRPWCGNVFTVIDRCMFRMRPWCGKAFAVIDRCMFLTRPWCRKAFAVVLLISLPMSQQQTTIWFVSLFYILLCLLSAIYYCQGRRGISQDYSPSIAEALSDQAHCTSILLCLISVIVTMYTVGQKNCTNLFLQ